MIITKIFLSVAIYALAAVLCSAGLISAIPNKDEPNGGRLAEIAGWHILGLAAALAGAAISWLWGV